MVRYAVFETLVETDWVKANLGRPGIKLVEIDVIPKPTTPATSPAQLASTGRRNYRTRSSATSSARRRLKSWSAAPAFRPATPSSPRHQQREELRRQLDRIRQPRRRAHRKELKQPAIAPEHPRTCLAGVFLFRRGERAGPPASTPGQK